MANGRCRMHGGRSGGPIGERNGAYKTGKYSQETKALRKWARDLAKFGEVFLATSMDQIGKKPPSVYRRRRHVLRARAEAKARAKAKEGEQK